MIVDSDMLEQQTTAKCVQHLVYCTAILPYIHQKKLFKDIEQIASQDSRQL